MARYCKNCGKELDEGSVFCNECGTRFGESQSSQANSNDLFKAYNVDMMDGEFIIRHSQINMGCLIVPLILIALGIFMGFMEIILMGNLYPLMFFAAFFNIFTIVGFLWLIVRIISYLSNDLILTNKRVFGKCGLISTTQMQSPLNKIDSVSFQSGLFGKLIGYGTVDIATTSSHFKFRFIKEGETFYNDIFNQLEKSYKEKVLENAAAIAEAISKN